MKKFIALALVGMLVAGSALAADPVARSVESINKEKAALSGKEVAFQGKVVKVNNGIMQRNFVHVQDGSGDANTNNLIATSKQTAAVGQTVKIVGKVTLNRDFGMGYSYPLLIEEASITPVQ
ncbi:hypothetical protein AB6Q56_03710 [Dechloromonas sp. ARDL1]|uniref:hypothetical protein n=1 Tax=Dechloromonas sp. ARDL1 TaxID=3322121 RepID=UPI003DA7753C